MGWWIAALVSALAAVGCGLGRRQQARKLSQLLQARATSVNALIDVHATVVNELGAGAFREVVKLSGTIRCEAPLTSPWTGQSCVAFCATTTALVEVQKQTTTTDSDGEQQTEWTWERRDEVLNRDQQHCRFELEQGNQGISVNPQGADLDLETVLSEVNPPNHSGSHGRRVIGIRREEAILRPQSQVFVVASCSDAGGSLQLEAPPSSGLFVVKRGSEEAFSSSLRRWQRRWTLGSCGLSGLTLALVLAALRTSAS